MFTKAFYVPAPAVFVVVGLFFTGYLFNLRDIPVWWEWYSYINIFR